MVGSQTSIFFNYLCVFLSICVLYVYFMCVNGCLVLNVFCPELKALRPMFNHISDYVICLRTPWVCFNHMLTPYGVNIGWSWGGEGTPPCPLGGRGGRCAILGAGYSCTNIVSVYQCSTVLCSNCRVYFISCYPVLQILRHWQYSQNCESCQGRIKAAGTNLPRRTHIFFTPHPPYIFQN